MVIVEPERRAARHQRTSWLSSVPLLAFVVIAYVAFAAGGADFVLTRFTVAMPSGGSWQISLGDMMLAFSLFVLFFEILKSTRTGGNSVADHALSMIVFVACLIVFLVWPPAATSLFFLIMLTTLVDVIAGFSVTIRSARRDYSVASDS
jgi:Flp pilus assembly protein TadB